MSKEIDKLQILIDANYRLSTLIGIALSMICDYKNLNEKKRDWFIQAVQDVIYENKPISPYQKIPNEQ